MRDLYIVHQQRADAHHKGKSKMFNVLTSEGIFTNRLIATVADMDAARAYLAGIAAAPKINGELDFELDADNPGCADAAIITRNSIRLYVVEPA